MREEETPPSLSSSSSARLRAERSCAEQDAEPRAFILKNKLPAAEENMLLLLGVVMATAGSGVSAARVVSGQMVCVGGAERPCYKMAYFHDVSSRVAFSEAKQACLMDGGALLSVESQSEQSDMEHLLQALRSGAVGGAKGGGGISDGDFWIGLTRGGGANHTLTPCPELYQWTDGSVATFRNWYLDEPSCGGEACVVMYHQPSAPAGLGGAYLHQWNDDRCNMKHNFICKYQPAVTAGGGVVTQADGGGSFPPQVAVAGSSGMLLLYVVIPTIPLLLLILVASGTCCFQTLSRSRPRTKAPGDQSNLWIATTPKPNGMEV
ncbi:chondrolectin [Poecilia latipinna]|uniref:chondrolectin n=1 Tax=Poecilia latipinna TaxID=48699 RepID=UPI00072E1C19|nr:PREDICTED: chondrolectin [Poecilia latipinna]XP_014880100.1 PREDICTED: chondrolectin [Poecilia latipinna]